MLITTKTYTQHKDDKNIKQRAAGRIFLQPAEQPDNLLEKYSELRRAGNLNDYKEWASSLSHGNKTALLKAKRDNKKAANAQYLAKLKIENAAIRLVAKVERQRLTRENELIVKQLKLQLLMQKIAAKQKISPVIKPIAVANTFKTCQTAIAPNGQVILLINANTKIYVKPGHDPEKVFNRYLNRNTEL